MATIKAIEPRSVHQIQSGQVIVDLVSVVKEVVENSLDAGATSIEVRFKNHGLDSIEVQDNGKGIAPEDYETIALKHYTSKLSSYEDLTSLDTFGFRGEALSSLCALSDFHVITARTQDGAVGKKLEFETSGQLKHTSIVAAQRGTTVSVENLFENLPVRRKELEKNIKREYEKAVARLYAYACISVGVRFAVSNQMPKAKKVVVLSTKSNTTTKENITNVFGAKMLFALVKLDLHLEMEPSKGPSTQSARNWSTQAVDRSMEVRVQGHISKPVFGEGRQAPDRQMFFVNSRPCTLPQVAKAFNEVYKSFNVSQSPFIFANLIMDTNAYDVNVSPDKRTIMLHDQAALLESLKRSLTELFEQTDHTLPQSQLPNRKLPDYKPLNMPRRATNGGSLPTEEDESEEDESESVEEHDHRVESMIRQKSARSDSTPPSLIQNWAERDTEMRSVKGPPNMRQDSISKNEAEVDKTVDRTHAASTRDDGKPGEQENTENIDPKANGVHLATGASSNAITSVVHKNPEPTTDSMRVPDPMGSPYDNLFIERPSGRPGQVKNINETTDHTHIARENSISISVTPSVPTDSEHDVHYEPPIPAVAPSSQKATPGPVQNAFDRMRPKRTPLQTAEITVGDTTTTAVLGSSPPYKKRRIHQPGHSQSIAQFGGSPLLARGLRNFAAPGSQLEIVSSNIPSVNRLPSNASDNDSEGSADEADQDDTDEPTMDQADKRPISSAPPPSDALDELLPAPADDDEYDEDYVDEHDKKIREDEKVARLIQEAELASAQPSEGNLKRASQVLKNTGNRKESTLRLSCSVSTSLDRIREQTARSTPSFSILASHAETITGAENAIVKDEINDSNAESRLSLTVSKADFERMAIIGQFNLGFILAVRPALDEKDEDELFIIDQHAADEKYNYERLQRTVTLQNQRLVRPKALELTAMEEEVILNNADALKANGFEIETASEITDDEPVGRRCRLLTLPMSREKTFEISDLEELLHLLSEAPAGSSEIPRPKKVQSMLAMRACRSSIMVGKTLTLKQMSKVVRHMGEMEKPWNCPHGRPTMRHLAGLGAWNAWREGDVIDTDEEVAEWGSKTDWKAFLEKQK